MSETTSSNSNNSTAPQPVDKRVIKKAGGRHLVYRINRGRWWFLPKPYALISNIEGGILVFYGMGQLWATHKKLRRINEWCVRVPRFINQRVVTIVDKLDSEISDFIEHIHDLDVIGTLIVERRVIEFHWTVPRGQRKTDQEDSTRTTTINTEFNKLAKAFAKLQLVGKEGIQDVKEEQIELKGSP